MRAAVGPGACCAAQHAVQHKAPALRQVDMERGRRGNYVGGGGGWPTSLLCPAAQTPGTAVLVRADKAEDVGCAGDEEMLGRRWRGEARRDEGA